MSPKALRRRGGVMGVEAQYTRLQAAHSARSARVRGGLQGSYPPLAAFLLQLFFRCRKKSGEKRKKITIYRTTPHRVIHNRYGYSHAILGAALRLNNNLRWLPQTYRAAPTRSSKNATKKLFRLGEISYSFIPSIS